MMNQITQERKQNILIILLTSLLLFTLTCSFAFAEEGDGDGSGNGINKHIPLTLQETLPADEELDVPLDITIELHFNKNICNVAILENNKKCFHLTSEDGDVIPVSITVPDDQVQRTYKRDAFLKPKKNLKPNTRYRVAVDSTLLAKNGNYIDNAHTFEFVTGDSTGASEPEELKELGSFGTQVFDSALPETKDSVPKANSLLDGKGSFLSTKAIAVLAACIIIVILILVTLISVRKRN